MQSRLTFFLDNKILIKNKHAWRRNVHSEGGVANEEG